MVSSFKCEGENSCHNLIPNPHTLIITSLRKVQLPYFSRSFSVQYVPFSVRRISTQFLLDWTENGTNCTEECHWKKVTQLTWSDNSILHIPDFHVTLWSSLSCGYLVCRDPIFAKVRSAVSLKTSRNDGIIVPTSFPFMIHALTTDVSSTLSVSRTDCLYT